MTLVTLLYSYLLVSAIETTQDYVIKRYLMREFDAFREFLNRVPNQFELTEYRVTEGELPEKPEECDAYLLTGSPKGVYDDEVWIKELGDFVRASYEADRKMVGICFGHQLLAHALGGHAEKSEKGWGMGRREAEIVSRKPWMTPDLNLSNLYSSHTTIFYTHSLSSFI